MKALLLNISLALTVAVYGQTNVVSGRVLHAETREPIHMANVFLAGTSIGGTSNEDGVFSFQGFEDGVYDVTVSFVGFETFSVETDFITADVFEREILLCERPISLREVVFTSDTKDRKRNLAIFEKNFLGTTANARRCRIKNSESLHLYLDPSTDVLYATSYEPLVIENRALGYRIMYLLTHFEYHVGTGTLYSFGIPKFDTLSPADARELKRWKEQRRQAFSGSLMHFMRSVVKDQLLENGFDVRRIEEVAEAVPSRLGGSQVITDSLQGQHQWTWVGFVDSVTAQPVRGAEITLPGDQTTIGYQGKLAVTYTKEWPEPAYIFSRRRGEGRKQESRILFRQDGIRINADGTFTDPHLVFVTGYWAWAEKLAELLPYDYKVSNELD